MLTTRAILTDINMKKHWHSLPLKDVYRELKSDSQGLSQKEFEQRLKKFGPNRLPKKKPFSRLKILFAQIKSPLIYILLVAGIITLFLEDYSDSIVIFGAVLLNAGVGYLQEKKANQALDKLKGVLKVRAVVLRSGQEKEVLQKDLVPGDVVFLRAGNKIPADARLIEGHNLSVNESALTGEWLAAKKKSGVLKKEVPLADRDNMVYLGTVAESGWAKAIVVKTGIKTALGGIAEAISETEEKKTPYQRKLIRFSRIVGIIIVLISVGIFLEGMATGGRFVEIFTISIAVAVAAIPEGLPVAMTVVLALGMQRVLKKKGLIRRLSSAETLGSTSIILTDKTGTLTEAKMRVAHLSAGKESLLAKRDKGNRLFSSKDKQALRDMTLAESLALKIGVACNESFIENPRQPMEEWTVRGRPTERALFWAGLRAGFSKEELIEKEPIIDQLLFNPSLKYAASLHRLDEKKNILYLIGSPEKLLDMSGFLAKDGKKEKLLLSDYKKIKEKIDYLTNQGLRVVAAAYQETSAKEIKEEKTFSKNLVMTGIFALHDPIREKTKEAINTCRQAGMRPIIVTGDHKLTARAVASQLGFKIKKENILEGRDLALMSEKEFRKKIKQIDIYARVEPAQKLRIVKAWQGRKEVVAMTGDGINDAPALKQADIGVALGSGTDVAQQVSDLVLLTDRFDVIVAAVEEGRAIIDNIRKTITYLLSDSFTTVILISVSLMLGWPLPVLAAQILWTNLIEDGPMGISLAFSKKEKKAMKQKPKDYSLALFNKEMKTLVFIIGLITDILLLGLFAYLLKYSGYPIDHIRSIIFAGLAIDSLFYVFSCQSLRRNIWRINPLNNRFLVFSWFFGIIMLVGAIYLSPLQSLLGTVALNSFDWILVLGLGIFNLSLIEMTKYWFIKKGHF